MLIDHRAVWDRILVAHRRYTRANGDALSGSLTYAVLMCGAPALLVTAAGLHAIGVPDTTIGVALHRSTTLLLPTDVAAAVDRAPPLTAVLRLTLAVTLIWTSLRLVRALRTAIRAMCGQNAGSGNPVRDALLDAGLGVLLLGALTASVVVTALAGRASWAPAVGILVSWQLFTGIMMRCSWPLPGRPSVPAALRAAFAAAVVLALLTLVARPYFAVTASAHNEIYRAAGGLVGVLVWCSLACRALLRATAWASTVPKGESE